MAGMMLATALLFFGGVFMIGWVVSRLSKRAAPLALVAFGCFTLAMLLLHWLELHGKPYDLTTTEKWGLISVGPGVFFFGLLAVFASTLLQSHGGRESPATARAEAIVCGSFVMLVAFVAYPELLARDYQWQAMAPFSQSPWGKVVLYAIVPTLWVIGLWTSILGRSRRQRQ